MCPHPNLVPTPRPPQTAPGPTAAAVAHCDSDALSMRMSRKVPLFHHLSEMQIDRLVESFIFVTLNKDETVFEQGMVEHSTATTTSRSTAQPT